MTFHQFKVYLKLSVTVLVILLVLLFILANRATVEVNLFWIKKWQCPTYAFIIINALLGIVIFSIIKGVRQWLKDYRQMRYENQVREHLVADKAKSQEK